MENSIDFSKSISIEIYFSNLARDSAPTAEKSYDLFKSNFFP